MVFERFVILCYERARRTADAEERARWITLGGRFEELAMDEALHRLADAVALDEDGRVSPSWERQAAE